MTDVFETAPGPMLFTDGLPVVDESIGYRGVEVAGIVGISYRQLDYWATTHLVEPSVRSASGSGSQRLYSYQDIVVLRVIKRLLDLGVSLQQIRKAVGQLRELGLNDLAQVRLMSDGASVYLFTSDEEVIDLIGRGQGVFGVAVGPVVRDVEATLASLSAVKADQPVDELARRRAARAVS